MLTTNFNAKSSLHGKTLTNLQWIKTTIIDKSAYTVASNFNFKTTHNFGDLLEWDLQICVYDKGS